MFGKNLKKGAMFGKLSQLDHINVFVKKKGAMFGLDARIALAIFGALSVISGAALYSAIQQSKVTALTTELNEFIKAYEAYYIDTGVQAPLDSTDPYNSIIKSSEFLTSSVVDWKGPYLSYKLSTDTGWENVFSHPTYQYINYLQAPYKNWSSSNSCSSDNTVPCSAWIIVRYVPTEIAKQLDLIFDGTANPSSGKLRHKTVGTSDHIFLYVMDVK